MDAPAQSVPIPAKPSRGKRVSLKPIYDTNELIEATATAVMSANGKIGLRSSPAIGPISARDRETLQRITTTNETVESFNARLSQKLRDLSDRITDRIGEKLELDAFKPGELSFALSVMEDKRVRLDGTSSLQNASVNIQVNNFGDSVSKDSLLSTLIGRARPVEASTNQHVTMQRESFQRAGAIPAESSASGQPV